MAESDIGDSMELSVLVVSCDKYSDLWRPFFNLFWRFWSDCPFKVYLGTNLLNFEDPRVISLAVDAEENWSRSLTKMLNAIPSPLVLVMLEDFFMRQLISSQLLYPLIREFKVNSAQMIRLMPMLGSRMRFGKDKLGTIRPKCGYRVSLQATIWRRETLLSLIKDGESPWEFEINASERSAAFKEGFYCTSTPVLPYKHHVVERGKWFRSEAKRFGAMDIGCDFSRRPIMSRYEEIIWRLRKVSGHPKHYFPWELRQGVKRKLYALFSRPRSEAEI